jgi:UMF1 family MFS transporter
MSQPAPPAQGSPPHAAEGTGGVWSPPGFGWAMFEFARNPYFLMVVTFVFPPYFAIRVVGDPVIGQAMVAQATWIAGVICALTAPLLGAMMDRGGKRKPLIAFFLGAMALAACALYWSLPPAMGGIGVAGTIIALVIAFVAYTYSEVMHNAMLTIAGRREVLNHISGAGLGLGNGAGALCLMIWAALLLSLGGLGIDADYPVQRFVGPAMAGWLCVFVIPFFLFMPDGHPPGGTWKKAAADLFRDETGQVKVAGTTKRFVAHIRGLFRDYPAAMWYLVARIAYADALTTLLAMAGVYTSGVLGWTQLEVGVYGIFGVAFAAIGAFTGGWLDQKFGPRRSIVLELSVILVVVVLMLSVTRDGLFFGAVKADVRLWDGMFGTLPSMVYMCLSAVVSASIGACLSSSRFMLVAIAPKHRISEFFGLYALSATVTVWMGPLLVDTVTRATHDQRWGMSTILILLVFGFTLFIRLKADPLTQGEGLQGERAAPPPAH